MSAVGDVVVIGGGLHGCSVALHCALRGLSVVVLERDRVGRHASGLNAGGVRRLGRHPAEIPLAVASLEIWQRIAELVDDDCGFRATGQVRVAESQADLDKLTARVAQVRALGYEHEEVIGPDELFALLPALSRHCVGGLLCRGDGYADPPRTAAAFARKAQALGVEVREGVRVDAVRRDGAGWRVATDDGAVAGKVVVNCAGAWGGAFAAALGEPVPLEPVALMMARTAPLPPFALPVVGAASRPLSFKQLADGRALIGGGRRGRVDLTGKAVWLDYRGIARGARTAAELFPVMRESRTEYCWAGIEGVLPDDIPVIGPSGREPGMFHAFGFCGHGFQLAPAVGRALAELIVTGATNLPLAPFAIDRFGGDVARTAPVTAG